MGLGRIRVLKQFDSEGLQLGDAGRFRLSGPGLQSFPSLLLPFSPLSLSILANSSNREQHRSVVRCIFFSLRIVLVSSSERFSDLFTRTPAAWLAVMPGGESGMSFSETSCSLRYRVMRTTFW